MAFRIEIRANPVWEFSIYWKRLAVVLVVLAVLGYLGLVTAIHRWWARDPSTRVPWSDVALAPVRWEKLRVKRGDAMIEASLQRLGRGEVGEGIFGLRAGLARSPANVSGRLALARINLLIDPPQAVKILEEGLRHSPSQPDLLAGLFECYLAVDASGRALEQCDRFLADQGPGKLEGDSRRLVENTRVSFLLEAGRAAEALARLEGIVLDDTMQGRQARLLRMQALLALGRAAEARALFVAPPRGRERTVQEVRLDAALALAAENEEELDSALRRWKGLAPGDNAPLFYAFRAWHQLKRGTLQERAEREILHALAGSESGLQSYGRLLLELGLPDPLRRVQNVAQRSRFNPFAFQAFATELALKQERIEDAARLLPLWEGTIEQLPAEQKTIPALIARLTRAALPDGAGQDAALLSQLAAARGRASPRFYGLVLRTIERTGRTATALAIAELGVRYYPFSVALRQDLERLRASAAEKTPVPAAPVAEPAAAEEFQSSVAALSAIDQSLAGRDPDRALAQIAGVRKTAAEWLAEAEPALAMREIRARLALQQKPTAMHLLRDLAVKPGLSRAAAFRLVRELIAEREFETALALAREIVRLLPGEKAASVLLLEAEVAMPPEPPAEEKK